MRGDIKNRAQKSIRFLLYGPGELQVRQTTNGNPTGADSNRY